LGQFNLGPFTDGYPSQFSKLGNGAFMRGDLQEICDFTQQAHLGIESYYEWIQARRGKRKVKPVMVNQPEMPASGSS
jgi:hypothetical protein